MSGVELLPFVWALPVAYIVASQGSAPQRGHLTLPGKLNLESESSQRFQNTRRRDDDRDCTIDDDQSIEVAWSRKGCSCFALV